MSLVKSLKLSCIDKQLFQKILPHLVFLMTVVVSAVQQVAPKSLRQRSDGLRSGDGEGHGE